MKMTASGIPQDCCQQNGFLSRVLLSLMSFFGVCLTLGEAWSAEPTRCLLIEVYYRSGDKAHVQVVTAAEEFKADRGGITLALRDIENDVRNQERLNSILTHFKIARTTDPVIYGCNRVIHDVSRSSSWTSQLQQLVQMEVFVRTGCSRCASAKQWLPTFMKEYPGLKLVYRDIAVDTASTTRLSQLVERHRTAAASVPVFHFCDNLVVGFDRVESTGERLRNILKRWTHECPESENAKDPPRDKATGTRSSSATESAKPFRLSVAQLMVSLGWTAGILYPDEFAVAGQTEKAVEERNTDPLQAPAEEFSLPLPGDDMPNNGDGELALPGEAGSGEDGQASDHIELPVFGKLSAGRLGMPLFTIAVGLVDGFNPCAMWVLLFLLSILVNLKDRKRILSIAGTFVVVSGLAYFAFMAAWLNVFMLIGYLRPIQAGLAVMAILIGGVHIKDFFAFKKGVSLSIPESVKPGIYTRVRGIVMAEHLAGAIAGAITLAILVNIIELLCTAGLPALYTNILMQQRFSSRVRYAYLSLYILAYMFDDSLMVLIVVWTLSKRKLQEAQGRWLKLVSGAAILLLGIIMLFHPELLR